MEDFALVALHGAFRLFSPRRLLQPVACTRNGMVQWHSIVEAEDSRRKRQPDLEIARRRNQNAESWHRLHVGGKVQEKYPRQDSNL